METYDDCSLLLEDLKNALWEQTLVEIDQNAYWNWASPVLRVGVGFFDDMIMEDGAVAEASMDGDVGSNGGTAPSSSGTEIVQAPTPKPTTKNRVSMKPISQV